MNKTLYNLYIKTTKEDVIIMNKTLYNLYIKTTKEDKTKVYAIHMSEKCNQTKPQLYAIHISG
jgi:hypothetical protein